MKISACLITLNEERRLPRCLESLVSLVDEIVVVDSGSTDGTRKVARYFGARFVQQPWLGYVAQKNIALDHAGHDWVLSIDADEELSPELRESILRVKRDPASILPGAPSGYEVSRLVFYRGRWIYHGDWYPDKLVRLFQRSKARFTGGRVHEKLELSGTTAMLPGHLYHYTYENAADRADRIDRYARLWAETARERGKKAAPWSGPLHAAVRFARGFVLKRGFLDGAVGWDIAAGNAREVRLKYGLLRKLNEQRPSIR